MPRGRLAATICAGVLTAGSLTGCNLIGDFAWIMAQLGIPPETFGDGPGYWARPSTTVNVGEYVEFEVYDDRYPGVLFEWSEAGGTVPTRYTWDEFPEGRSYFLNRAHDSTFTRAFSAPGVYQVGAFGFAAAPGEKPKAPTDPTITTITVVDPGEEYIPPEGESAPAELDALAGRNGSPRARGRRARFNLRLGNGVVTATAGDSGGALTVDQTIIHVGRGKGSFVGRLRPGLEQRFGKVLGGTWRSTIRTRVDIPTGNGWLAGTALAARRIGGRQASVCLTISAPITGMQIRTGRVKAVAARGSLQGIALTGTVRPALSSRRTSLATSGTVRVGRGKRLPSPPAACGNVPSL